MTWLAGAAVVCGVLALCLSHFWVRRILWRLDRMLNDAIAGTFSVRRYDESRLSSIENRMMQYLAASSTSAENLAAEKARIQQLIADVSHQTKTPVANIMLYAELMGEHDLPEGCRDCLDALNGQAEKLRFLIASLVKAGRLETGIIAVQPRQACLRELLEATVKQAQRKAADKNIALTWNAGSEYACFDPKWTQEALFNLIDNAVKYTPRGGCVTVSVTAFELFCRVNVEDTGMGIGEEEQNRIFERFYRSAAVADEQGVGLGLYLAREIATAQGGYIRVISQKGKGSTFSLFLPC